MLKAERDDRPAVGYFSAVSYLIAKGAAWAVLVGLLYYCLCTPFVDGKSLVDDIADEIPWGSWAVARNKRIGDEVVERLEAYKAEHGRYPEYLEKIPDALPSPDVGRCVWEYRSYEDGAEFYLDVQSDGWYQSLSYESDRGKWRHYYEPPGSF